MPHALGRRRNPPEQPLAAPAVSADKEEIKALKEEIRELRRNLATDMELVGRDIRSVVDEVENIKAARRAEKLAVNPTARKPDVTVDEPTDLTTP